MVIGINASFLRKPGTGIGQVTINFCKKLMECSDTRYILYTEEPIDFPLPSNFRNRCFLPRGWTRDDLVRKILWERRVATEAVKDGCDVFLSLYQASTRLPRHIRHTMVVHDIIPRLFPAYLGNVRKKLYWHLAERGIRAADHIVAISEHTKSDLVHTLGVPAERITVAYLDVAPRFRQNVSEATLQSVLKKYSLEPGYIYHGGGLEVRKNTEMLLRAYQQLTDNRKQKTNADQQSKKEVPLLVISGKIFEKTNTLATDVQGLVEELGLQEKVKLLGFVPDEDMPALYRGSLFFVYPSLYEGFGLPVLEALCMGVPVLASNTSSLPEVGGDAVLYADPRDVEEVATQMERLSADQTLRSALIARSASQAVQFSWETFVKKVVATFTA